MMHGQRNIKILNFDFSYVGCTTAELPCSMPLVFPNLSSVYCSLLSSVIWTYLLRLFFCLLLVFLQALSIFFCAFVAGSSVSVLQIN